DIVLAAWRSRLLFHDSVGAVMFAQACCIAGHGLGHDGSARGWAIKAEHGLWKVQRLLDHPDRFMFVGWQDSTGIANGDPTDRHRRIGWKRGLEVHHAVDACLGTCANAGTRE